MTVERLGQACLVDVARPRFSGSQATVSHLKLIPSLAKPKSPAGERRPGADERINDVTGSETQPKLFPRKIGQNPKEGNRH